jgi:hypothetical protein
MSRIEQGGLSAEVPGGWDGAITGGGFPILADGAKQPTVLHAGSFPLPADRASFGSHTVTFMTASDVFVVLFEYGPESADTPLFAAQGMPRTLQPRQFDRNALQQGVAGQSGLQQFFTEEGRAFCLYVVLGSHVDRADLVPQVNAFLETIEID